MLDDNDKSEIKRLISEAMDLLEESRRSRNRELRMQEEINHPVVTKLYLVSMGGHHIAFPDERGRAIFTQAFYAKISMKDKDSFYSQRVSVVAYGDGQLLKEPVSTLLTSVSVVALAEVPESVLHE